MPADTLSSHLQTICMPPLHLEKVIVQRGTIIMFMPAGAGACVPIIPLGEVMGMAIPLRSIIIAVVILISLLSHWPVAKNPRQAEREHSGNSQSIFQVMIGVRSFLNVSP
jgi:hypothetical protein